MKIPLEIEEGDLLFMNDTPYEVEWVKGGEIRVMNKKKMGYREMSKDALTNAILVAGEVRLVKSDYRGA